MFQSFNKSKETVKELENKLNTRQELIGLYAQVIENLSTKQNEAGENITQLEEEYFKRDLSMTGLAEAIKNEKIRTSEKEKRLLALGQRLENFCVKTQTAGKAFEEFKKGASDQKKNLETLATKSEDYQEPMNGLHKVSQQLNQETAVIGETIEQMQEFGRQMGVLSLNAAIEAGRMGESGHNFVLAAEEVRSYAAKYQEAADMVGQQVITISEKMTQMNEQITTITEFLDKKNGKIGKVVQEFEHYINTMHQPEIEAFMPEMVELAISLKELATNESGAESFANIINIMKQAGAAFEKEQLAMEGLKENLNLQQGQIKLIK
jgi:methyl-accepting chemotaxis protein